MILFITFETYMTFLSRLNSSSTLFLSRPWRSIFVIKTLNRLLTTEAPGCEQDKGHSADTWRLPAAKEHLWLAFDVAGLSRRR